MPPVSLRRNSFRDHVIVCGDDGMAFRLVEELVYRHRENVTVILPSRRRRHGPQISRVPTVRVVENDQLDADALSAARIGTAKALALMAQDDVGNIHAALRALEITDVRVVVRVYNTYLGRQLEPMLGDDCVLLSDAEMASPSFVTAALNEDVPRYRSVEGRTLFITEDPSARGRLTWPIASSAEGTTLLPATGDPAALYMTVAQRRPRAMLTASKHRVRRLATRMWDEMREILDRKLRFITLLLLLVILFGTFMIWDFHGLVDADGQVVRNGTGGEHISWLTSAYITLLTAAGGIDPDLGAVSAEQSTHVLVAFAGVLLVPVFTASIVENMVGRRLAVEAGRLRGPISDHVIVVGLGNVGTQVAVQLHNLGVPVVAVEQDAQSRGVERARSLGIPVVYGDASTMETLDAAQVRTCRALVAVTSNDIVNLEAALHAHRSRAEVRTVLRLFEPDLAERVQRHFDLGVTLSVAAVAASEFAAAMINPSVKASFAVGRHRLLVGKIRIAPGAELVGRPVGDIDVDEQLRVLAIKRAEPSGSEWEPHRTSTVSARRMEWNPDLRHPLASGDTVLVLATRRGLSATVTRASAPQEE